MDTRVPLLESLAASLGLADFDLLIVGDGAGSFVDTASGWHCLSYVRATKEVKEHFGGANGGTNNYAELEPTVFALTAYRHVLWTLHARGVAQKAPRVAIVSDSEVTVRCGTGQYARKANGPLWASIEWLENKGWKFQWAHVPRNSNAMSERSDEVAKQVRGMLARLNGEKR